MKVVCKNIDRLIEKDKDILMDKFFQINIKRLLTIDKIYDVIAISLVDYLIIDDSGNRRWYPSKRFISLKQVRDNKLKELGI